MPHFHYHHLRSTEIIRDVRKNTASTIAWEQFYFLGFKIAAAGGDRYHHALILADSHDTFLDGIAGEYLPLLDYSWIKSVNEISVVFVQNLMSKDRQHISPSKNNQRRTPRTEPTLIGRNQHAFTVVGVTDHNKVCTLEVDSDNALTAMAEANEQIFYEFGHRFKPLLVTKVHPVMLEFCELLDTAMKTLTCLMGETISDRGCIH